MAVGSGSAVRWGLAWAAIPDADDVDPTLYSGGAGIVLTMLEAYRQFDDDRYAEAALRGGRALAEAIDRTEHCSFYFGLTGMAFALRGVADQLGDSAAGAFRIPIPSTGRS